MRYTIIFINLSALLMTVGCTQSLDRADTVTVPPASNIIMPQGTTIESRFNPPPGFHRVDAPAGSFSRFLRSLKLKENGAYVHYYNGVAKPNNGIYDAVLDMDIGTKDLQQCADAVIRLRAEYLFNSGNKDRIHFNLTNGFVAYFSKWAEGYRISVKGNTTEWVKRAEPSNDYHTLREYFDFVFNYAGSLSLSKELQPVAWADMQPGDVLIIGGSPGHAETVMDMAEDGKGHKVFMLSQSYMPAQDIQILHNPEDREISPWYTLKSAPYTIHTPQYDFSTGDLKRSISE